MARLCAILSVVWAGFSAVAVTAFPSQKPPPSVGFSLSEPLQSIFGAFLPKTTLSPEEDRKRTELKDVLLNECRLTDTNAKNKRKRIEKIIEDLMVLSPVNATAESEMLQKKWFL